MRMFLPRYISLNWFSYFLFIAVLFHCSTFSLQYFFIIFDKSKAQSEAKNNFIQFSFFLWELMTLQITIWIKVWDKSHVLDKKKVFFPFWIIKTLILIILNNKVQKEGRPKGAKTCWDIVRNSTVQCQSVKIPPPPQKTNKKLWKFTRL